MDEKLYTQMENRVERFERLKEMDAPRSILQDQMYLIAKGLADSKEAGEPKVGELISRIAIKRANEMNVEKEYEELLAEICKRGRNDLE